MDDLISRKTLLNDLCTDREEGTFCFTDSQAEAADKIIMYVAKRIEVQPTIEAVPLDKLCEWLTANRVSIPCELCEYDDAGKCTVQNDMSKPCPNTTRDWRRVITNWMEGLDDHR